MKILVVNDDGIHAKGLRELALKLQEKHEVIVVAPDSERSGASHSVTFHGLLNYKKENIEGVKNAYSLSGSPCDCVKFAVEVILGENPDMVVSGINNCCNIATDVLYSGTVNAAIEGGVLGIKSIAVSLECNDGFYGDTVDFIVKNIEKVYSLIEKPSTIFNFNVPCTRKKDIMGVKFALTGIRVFKDEYQYIENKGYMITGFPISVPNLPNSDAELFADKYITISPVKVDFNDYEMYEKLKGIKL